MSKVLPTRQFILNSRSSPITDVTDTKRSTIQVNLDKDAFRIPDDQDCLLSVITAEIPMQTFTFNKIPTFQISNQWGTSSQTFTGIDTNTTYTVSTLVAALNNTNYSHFGYTASLSVTATAGTNVLTFTVSIAGFFTPISFIFFDNIPQLGINAIYNGIAGVPQVSPYTAPSAPLLIPKYYIVKSPDIQTMYAQPIAKIQTDLTYQNTTIYYKNFSQFDTRVLSPFVQTFQLQLTDEDGIPINLRGADWSINIQFKFIKKQKLEIM